MVYFIKFDGIRDILVIVFDLILLVDEDIGELIVIEEVWYGLWVVVIVMFCYLCWVFLEGLVVGGLVVFGYYDVIYRFIVFYEDYFLILEIK